MHVSTDENVVEVHHELAWIHETQPLAVHWLGDIWRISHAVVGYQIIDAQHSQELSLDSCRRLAEACDWTTLTPENSKDGPYRKAVLNEIDRLKGDHDA